MPVLAIPAVLIALIAIMLILCTAVLALIASKVIPDVPLIGGAIRGAVVTAVNAVRSVLLGWADDAAIPIGYLFMGIALTVWWVAAFIVNVATHAIQVGRYAIGVSENLYNEATGLARTLYNEAIAFGNTVYRDAVGVAESLYNDSIGHADQLYNDAVHDAEGLYNQSIAHADALYNEAVGFAQTVYSDAVGVAEQLYNQTVAGTAADIASVITQIKAAEDLALQDVERALATAEAEAAHLVTTGVSGLSTSLDQAAADVLNPTLDALFPALDVIAPALPTAIETALGLKGITGAGDVTGIIGALGVLAPAIAGVATEVAECTVPMCDNLGGLSNLFRDLTDAALLGLLLAFLAECAHNPSRAADDVQTALGGVTRAATAGVRDLIGV